MTCGHLFPLGLPGTQEVGWLLLGGADVGCEHAGPEEAIHELDTVGGQTAELVDLNKSHSHRCLNDAVGHVIPHTSRLMSPTFTAQALGI